MADKTGISWTDATWNPVVGCSVISPGCTNCYAMKLAYRLELMGSAIYRGHTQMTKAGPVWNGIVDRSNWGQVIKPLFWQRPRRIFVNSMSDLFHDALADEVIDQVFAVMALCPQHIFQVLTKRTERMRAYMERIQSSNFIWHAADELVSNHGKHFKSVPDWPAKAIPLPNVWLGVSVEDQTRAEERIPLLKATPAAKRFVSCEPLLGPVNLNHVKDRRGWGSVLEPQEIAGSTGNCVGFEPAIDWVIAGGESGRGARPMHPDWARGLRDQCAMADVPFFFKQWGDWLPAEESTAPYWRFQDGREIDGHVLPEDIADDPPGWDSGLSYDLTESHAIFRRVGKHAAGDRLDGIQHHEFPA